MQTRKEIARSLVESDPTLLTQENLDMLIEKIEEAYDNALYLDYLEER
jgi:hypothetical protein